MKYQAALLVGLLAGSYITNAQAAVSAAEAQRLGTTLTLFGAKKAGSVDGAIPPYTGGIAAMKGLPAASATTGYPDPFANEKPLFTITKENMAKYVTELTPGAVALLDRYPRFRIDVYPTHRTASYPGWVLKNTLKNATAAREIGDGDGVEGAYGGIPFPIPKDGYQVMWNNFLAYHPAYCKITDENYLVGANGTVTDVGTITSHIITPYYNPNAQSLKGIFWRYEDAYYHKPIRVAGSMNSLSYPINYNESNQVNWFYSPATRRIRRAPEFQYDTPIAVFGGAIDFDEINLFSGKMNKFNFKLIGKKEMIVPYNDYTVASASKRELLEKHFINPQVVRWERHRVWIVEAVLKPGQRDIYSRWFFYVDEDSWQILATDSYDHAGHIYRVGFAFPYQDYSDGEATNFGYTFVIYDLSNGSYVTNYVNTNHKGYYHCSTKLPNMAKFTPQAMAARAIR